MFAALLALSAALPNDDAATRAAVERATPYLQTAGDRWVEEKNCVSCHRVGNQLWALGAAAGIGAAGDGRFEERAAWAVASTLAKTDDDAPAETDDGAPAGDDDAPAGAANREGVAQLLLAPGAVPDPAERAALVALLRDGQREDGGWDAGGQLPMQKRPKAETDVASALWMALALHGEDAADPAVGRAAAFVDAAGAADSVEVPAARLLLAAERNEPTVQDRLIADLRARQRPDGGWGWLQSEESDALGTGLALYALLESGVAPDDPAALAARRFLVDAQRPDGAWPVRGTKEKSRGRVTETASYWGAAWATAALARSLADDR
ncbi:prenyltransferase/squalene oxidase repeat-containing protein [Alienimonas californiensis]|uniref:Cytochrome c domain-containing protein n=1 Tax=Alienimonas californiensis TaxID=2527989 RepID=A0A517PAQ5_9PLAN|nr:prenyltransferase/squalene oxidase repeat-containing protein [Alienimonas californiensis]QDT16453.1 hypothetical protein CA12_25560 [Alienimonas californiensis]